MVGTATEYALAIDCLPVNSALTLYGLSGSDYEKLLQQSCEASAFRVSYDEGKVQIKPVSFLHKDYAPEEYALAMIDRLPVNSALTLYDLSWSDYEKLLQQFGEAPGFRVSYDEGKVQIMPVSFAHEYYAEFLKQLVGLFSHLRRLKVLHFGSATLKRQSKLKGVEPDASFYVQSAALIGSKINLDLESDPPPDVIVEVDIHHESLTRFPIYASLGISEIWHYDDQRLTIYCLHQNQYVARPASRALPMLTSAVLTEFLTRSKSEDQYDTLLAFEEWLRVQPSQ